MLGYKFSSWSFAHNWHFLLNGNWNFAALHKTSELAKEKHQLAWHVIKITLQPPLSHSAPMPSPLGYFLVTTYTAMILFTVLSTPWLSKSLHSSHIKCLRSPLSSIPPGDFIGTVWTALHVHQIISHINRTNNYSSRKDSSLAFCKQTPLVSFW